MLGQLRSGIATLMKKNKVTVYEGTGKITGPHEVTVAGAEESVFELKRLQKQMIDYICENSKFPRKKLQQIIDKKQDYWFSADEALKYKIIDEIIDEEPKQTKSEKQTND